MADKRDILIRLLGEETVSRMAGKAGDGLDKLGDSLEATEKDAKDLDRQIADVEADLKTLAVAFARTGDAADRLDISKAMRKQQAELRKLTKSKDFLPDFGKAGEEAASGFGTRFVARLGPLLASAPMGPVGAAVGAGIALAAAPTIAALVSGAVVGGAGLGGVVGGVVLAARDPRVKAAGSELGTFILSDLEARASGFVPPVLEGIGDIRAGWKAMAPDLDRVFESSRFVDPLVKGAISGGQKLVGGLADAIEQADPVIDALGRGFDQVGEAAGDALSSMAGDADEGAAAIDDLTMAITRLIETSAAIVHAGANVKGWSDELDIAIDKGRYWFEDLRQIGPALDLTADGFAYGSKEALAFRDATTGVADAADFATLKTAGMTDAEITAADASHTYRAATDETGNAIDRTGDKAAVATVQVESLTDAIKRMAGENISAEQAQMRLEEAIDRATEAGRKNNDGIDRGTAKGRANRELLVSLAEASNTAAGAIMKTTNSHDLAAAATERGRRNFLAAADAMNVEKGEALRLADQLFGIPNIKRTVTVQEKQALAAIAKVQAGLGKINSKNIHIGVYWKTNGDLKLPGGTSLKGLSTGGPVTGTGPKGVDSVIRKLAPGEHVWSADEVDAAGGHQAMERMRAAIRGGGASARGAATSPMARSASVGGAQRVEVVLRIDGNDRGIVGALLKGIKDMGGNPAVLGIGGNW